MPAGPDEAQSHLQSTFFFFFSSPSLFSPTGGNVHAPRNYLLFFMRIRPACRHPFFFFFMQGMFCREKQIDAAASGQQKETKDSRPSRCRTPPAKSWESQPNPTTSLKMYAHGAGSSRPQYLYGCQAKQASMSASLSPTVPSRGELAGWLAGSLARRTGGKSGRDFEERRIACLPSPPPALAEITWCRRRIIRDILRSGDEIIIPRPVLARAHCGTGQVGSLRRGGGLVAGSGVRM